MKTFTKLLKSINDLTGKTYIVTGANSGLGFALSDLLLTKNATLIMANRSIHRTEEAIAKLKHKHPHANIIAYAYDQASKAAIKSFVRQLVADSVKFAGIVLNAGVYLPAKHAKTTDGLALTFGVNYFGNYFLVQSLSNAGLLTHDTRIVFTTSLAAHKKIDETFLQNLISGENITRHNEYRGSKAAINMFALALSEKHESLPFKCDSSVYIYHPGVTHSNITRFAFKPFNVIAKAFMSIVFHSTRKAACGALIGLTANNVPAGTMIVPRGPKEVRGLPRYKKTRDTYRAHLTLLLETTNKLI